MENVEEVVNKLKHKNYHISFAESITGGLCAATLISVAGASNVIGESLVTYSEKAKMKYLYVARNTLANYGVVSNEVAQEMVLGLHELTESEVCVSLTGLAGPDGDGVNPVGTVCMGFYIDGKLDIIRKVFEGDRNQIRENAVKFVFERLNKALWKEKHY